MSLGLLEQRIILRGSFFTARSKRTLIFPATGTGKARWDDLRERGLIEEREGGIRLTEAGELLKLALLKAGEEE